MFDWQNDAIQLVITGGSVAFALAVALWAHRVTASVRALVAKWRRLAEELEWKVDRSDAIFAAYPGVIIIWEDDPIDPMAEPAPVPEADDDARSVRKVKLATDWGKPRLFGSASGLQIILRFANASDGPDAGSRILDGIADYDAHENDANGEQTTLRRCLEKLRTDGIAFSITIDGPHGSRIEVDGRPAGRRAVIWLNDSTAKRIEVASSKERPRDADVSGVDPVGMIDLLAKSPIPVFRLSGGLKLVWGNPAYLAAVEARSLPDATSRDSQLDERVKDQARKVLTHGVRADEIRAVVVKGERRWHLISIFPVSGGVAGVAFDIHREQETRDALERYARAQDEALNHLRDAVVIFTPEQKLAFYNRAFRELFKFDEAWLNQRPQHGEMLDRMRERKLIPHQSNYQAWRAGELGRYATVDREGTEELWTLPDERMLRVARVRHPLGGLLMVFDDRTKEISLETRYNTLIKVQKATLDRLNEGVVVFGSDGRLKLFNAAFVTMWGIPADALGPDEPFDRVVELCRALFADMDEWAEIKARVTDVGAEGRRAVSREIIRSNDTVLTYLQRPLPDGSTVIAFHDITAAREVEGLLENEKKALAEAERVKSRFVENVSYHLRTPLTSVMGFSQLLAVTAEGMLNESQMSQLDAIIQAAADLDKLVENIIVVAAIDANKLALDLEEAEVRPILEGAVGMVKTSDAESRVRISINCPREVGAIVCDQLKLRQALFNLIDNATIHTGQGGRIEVGAERIGSAGMRIWVEDDGEGIPLDRQGKVFEAFESDGKSGAGLGLALVQKFVEMHGGWIELESTPGIGTRVTVHLPADPRSKLPSEGGSKSKRSVKREG